MIEFLFQNIPDNLDRRRAWAAGVSDLIEVDFDEDTIVPLNAYQRCYNLKQIMFEETSSFKQVVRRRIGQISAQNIDHIFISLQLSGRSQVTTCNGVREIGRDSLFVLDLSQEFSLAREGGGAQVGAIVPRRLLGGWRGDPSAWHGRVVPPETMPVAHLLANHLKELSACLPTATPPQKDRLADASVALLNAAFVAEAETAYHHTGILGIAARQIIDQNLATVDAEMLAARLGLSRTPLYKLFEADGGVYAYIRGRRLAHAMQQLTRTNSDRRPRIAQLAFECGFENERVFSRAFRRKYGVNPSEVDPAFVPSPTQERTSRLMTWLREL